jgi:hypothetical protein
MSDRESVLRCLAFMTTSYRDYTRRDFDDFLTTAMKRLNDMTATEREDVERRFRRAMRSAHDLFGESAFRKPESAGTRPGRSPINKALLEVWTSHLAALSDAEISRLRRHKDKLNEYFNRLIARDLNFVSAISQGTGKPEKVRKRFQSVERLIRRALK